jgi:hypothetical protein
MGPVKVMTFVPVAQEVVYFVQAAEATQYCLPLACAKFAFSHLSVKVTTNYFL